MISLLAAPILALALSPTAIAATVDREHLLTFASLPEALRSVADEAFADLDRSKGKQGPAGRFAHASTKFAEFDLNQDGSPELLLLRLDGKGCADNTCPVRVLQRQGNGWRTIQAWWDAWYWDIAALGRAAFG